MCIIYTIIAIILVILTAKTDKAKCIKEDSTKWHLEKRKDYFYNDWYEYYNGRKGFYIFLILISFIPYINIVIVFLYTITIICILFKMYIIDTLNKLL